MTEEQQKMLTPSQRELIWEAGKLVKQAFSKDNMGLTFNLSQKHDNINFNIKYSDILYDKPTK